MRDFTDDDRREESSSKKRQVRQSHALTAFLGTDELATLLLELLGRTHMDIK